MQYRYVLPNIINGKMKAAQKELLNQVLSKFD